MGTLFASVYNRFLGKITDDMYMELTPEDTIKDLQTLLIDAIPEFEFPRKSLEYIILERPIDKNSIDTQGFVIKDVDGNGYEDVSNFTATLSSEEINILAILMMNNWLQRQITTIENIRMKYSGTDFKMTSQANHLAKLLTLLKETQRQSLHMQRLYKRRRTSTDGTIISNWDIFREDSAINSSVEFDNEDIIIREVIFDGGII